MSTSTRLDIIFNGVNRTSKTLKEIEYQSKRTKRQLASGFAAVFGITKVIQFGRESVQAFQVQQAAQKKLIGVITATGGAAGRTSREIMGMASALQSVTNFDDDDIVNAAAILGTFKNIKEKAFDESLESILDMSAALDQDLRSAAIQVGKAMNDPLKGVTALGRAGVTFSEEQKKMIKGFMKQNDIASAQAVILAELKGEFGGVAKAMADPMTQLVNQWGDFKEGIGETVFGLLEFSGVLDGMKSSIEGNSDAFDGLSSKIFSSWQNLKAYVRIGTIGFETLADIAGRFSAAMSKDVTFKEAFKDFETLEERFTRIFTDRDEAISAFEEKAFAAKKLREQIKGTEKDANDAAGAIKKIKDALTPMTLAGTYKAIQAQFGKLDPLQGGRKINARDAGIAGTFAKETNELLKQVVRNTMKTTDAVKSIELEAI